MPHPILKVLVATIQPVKHPLLLNERQIHLYLALILQFTLHFFTSWPPITRQFRLICISGICTNIATNMHTYS